MLFPPPPFCGAVLRVGVIREVARRPEGLRRRVDCMLPQRKCVSAYRACRSANPRVGSSRPERCRQEIHRRALRGRSGNGRRCHHVTPCPMRSVCRRRACFKMPEMQCVRCPVVPAGCVMIERRAPSATPHAPVENARQSESGGEQHLKGIRLIVDAAAVTSTTPVTAAPAHTTHRRACRFFFFLRACRPYAVCPHQTWHTSPAPEFTPAAACVCCRATAESDGRA